jgi:GWxTD domain-containing protein
LVRRRRFLHSLEPLQPSPAAIPATVPVFLSASAPAPLACGVLRPRIVLPADLPRRLSPAELEAVLIHESLHVRHRDNLVADLAMLMRCLYWFHPLVWWLDHRLLVEREFARDEQALTVTGAEPYLSGLVKVCQSSVAPRCGATAMSSSKLHKRMELIMRSELCKTNPISRRVLVGLAALAAVATSIVLVTVPVTAQDRPLTPYEKWLAEDVAYLITPPERAAFARLTTDPERERFIEQFWLLRDPTPGTVQNEAKEEHYRRIAYANQRFPTGSTPGWRTPRGRVYIVYGPADEIESFASLVPPRHPNDGKERWRYRTGPLSGMVLEFDLNEAAPRQ